MSEVLHRWENSIRTNHCDVVSIVADMVCSLVIGLKDLDQKAFLGDLSCKRPEKRGAADVLVQELPSPALQSPNFN